MSQLSISPELLKQLLKEALMESLQENRDLFREVFAEALEDIILAEAIREGRNTEFVERDKIVDLLEVPD